MYLAAPEAPVAEVSTGSRKLVESSWKLNVICVPQKKKLLADR